MSGSCLAWRVHRLMPCTFVALGAWLRSEEDTSYVQGPICLLQSDRLPMDRVGYRHGTEARIVSLVCNRRLARAQIGSLMWSKHVMLICRLEFSGVFVLLRRDVQ